MSALPIYEVQFMLLERRLNDRRITSGIAVLPESLKQDRRQIGPGRRIDDCNRAMFKLV